MPLLSANIMHKLLLISSLVLFGPICHAQRNAASAVSLRLTASSSFFLCDLGGKNAKGSNDLSDLNLEQTRYAFGAGLQFYHGPLSFGAGAFYARLSADDRLTTAKRSIRQLHAITDVVETAVNVEYTIPSKIPVIGNFYFNTGVGLVIFRPMARYNRELVHLRPLGTEGQNYLPGKQPYSRFAPVLPFGFGYRINFHNGSSLSVDLNLRKSFTDYLDDVSTVYADVELIRQESGDVAAYLADPSIEGQNIGAQRGDPKDNDQYFLLGFRYEFPIRLSKSYKLNNNCSFQSSGYKHYPIRPNSKHRHRRRLFR